MSSITQVSLGANTFTGAQVAPSLALGGATLGANVLAATGAADISGALSVGGNVLGSGDVRAGGAKQFYFAASSAIGAPTNGTFSFQNFASSSGIVLDVTTDSTAKFFARDGTTQALVIVAASPVSETNATHTVGATESDLICNRAGTVTVTLPAAASFPGRRWNVSTIQAQTVVSNASNVVPVAGGAAGTAILAATAGKWATLISNGTNWVIMASN